MIFFPIYLWLQCLGVCFSIYRVQIYYLLCQIYFYYFCCYYKYNYFFISFLGSSLGRNTTDFCVLLFMYCNLTEFVCFNSLCRVVRVVYAHVSIHNHVNCKQTIALVPLWFGCLFKIFACLIVQTITSRTMLNGCWESTTFYCLWA